MKYSLIVNGHIERESRSWMYCVGHYWARFSMHLNAIVYIHIQGSPLFYYLNPENRRFMGPYDVPSFNRRFGHVKHY